MSWSLRVASAKRIFFCGLLSILAVFSLITSANASPTARCEQISLSIGAPSLQSSLTGLPPGVRGMFRGLMTFPIPALPLWNALKSRDRRFLVFVEKPLLGVVTSSIAVSLARQITGSDAPWFRSFLDSWLSYTLKDVIGTGVALDPRFNRVGDRYGQWKAYFINYGYTVGSYALVTTLTAGSIPFIRKVLTQPELATATDLRQASYGVSLIAFSVAWPLLSQRINSMVLPHVLFKRFPARSVLEEIRNPSWSNERLLEKYRHEMELAEAAYQRAPSSEAQALKKSWQEKRDIFLWVKWMRVGLEPGDKYPFLPISVRRATGRLSERGLWAVKTTFVSLVATGMVMAYFTTRDLVVGPSAQEMAFLTESIHRALLR